MKKKKCDICNNIDWCDSHHIMSKCYGGKNIKSNRTNLCTKCHRLVHIGEIIIEG
jgi:uncharacterized protein YlaI